MKESFQSEQAGFSMVELLVAVVILAVGVLGLAGLQVTAIKTNSQSSNLVSSTAIAQEVVEDIAGMSASDPFFDASNEGSDKVWPGGPVTVNGAETYDITYDLDSEFDNVPNLCRITVKVNSQTKVMKLTGNEVRSVSMTTFKRAL